MAHKRHIAADAFSSQSARPWRGLASCRAFTTSLAIAALTCTALYIGVVKSGLFGSSKVDPLAESARVDDLGSFVRVSGTQVQPVDM